MSETAVAHALHGQHQKLGFVRTYIFSIDHKMIGRQFLFMGLLMIIVGGLLAMLVRWQLAWPETPVPGLGIIPEPYIYPGEQGGGIIPPQTYNAIFTMHATIMIFFVVMPIMVGTFGNFLIPLMIGTGDMAFPRLNMLSFWVGAVSSVVMLASFFVPGGPAAGGWTSYATLAAKAQYTGVEWGQHLWIISLLILGVSSLMGSINYITTIINMRAPGMTYFRMPLTVWSLFITAILLLLALPVLTAALAMLLFDRVAGTNFFLPEGGGEPLLWQHMFWFFGHPEVYILVLPAMGVTSDILSTFSRKPIFGYHAMAFSMIAIAFLSWIVWGHHMFVSGMNPLLGTAFMMTTMVIAVPSAIKTFNWTATLFRGSVQWDTPMIYVFCFIGLFLIGGLTGLFLGNLGLDVHLTDTYFIVAHFHYIMVGGAIMGYLGGLHYWWPKMTGRLYPRFWSKISALLVFVGFNLTFFPQFVLGYLGMPRRYWSYPPEFQVLNVLSTAGATILGVGYVFPLVYLLYSLRKGAPAGDNPWGAAGLEWETTSPPPTFNFATEPVVGSGPYDFSNVKEAVFDE